ncbi:TetR/AcrR family transcriptional regulator [Salipiger mucosus]|uniref:Transcriptional regulator, TetR family n=1 Tax=Salipiger mucosus DSM 16094 TaxID=1123237 RepID=S9RY76_9RHOB|nr:TetR/AcrR family transcriptional regulator [Salipiger mucosus]EPX82980.1 Transcriptional regulator, TetR family [Salipiger mucosus DSM 16094]
MTAEPAEVRRGRKYDQVVAGAREVFMRDGFEGASVDEIARAAGVSKATLYSYFPDKRLLFMEMATLECARQADEALTTIDQSQPPRVVLPQVAQTFLSFILSETGQRIFRICVAEADRFPDLGRRFYQSGPMLMRDAVTRYMQASMARGELCIDDLDLAADQFTELCKADLWIRTVFGIRDSFEEAEIARVVDGAVETFLARYSA